MENNKIPVTLSIDKDVYNAFKTHCNTKGFMISMRVEIFMDIESGNYKQCVGRMYKEERRLNK